MNETYYAVGMNKGTQHVLGVRLADGTASMQPSRTPADHNWRPLTFDTLDAAVVASMSLASRFNVVEARAVSEGGLHG